MASSSMGVKFLLMVIGSVFLPIVDCYRCYECYSVANKDCGYEFNKTNVKVVDCQEPYTCKKVLLPTVGGGYEPIKRGCFNGDLCTHLSVCLSCDSDLCNSSSNTAVTLIIVVICVVNNIILYC